MTHSAQTCIKTGHVAALLLFDIQGFFNNLHVDCLVHVFSLLGFAPQLCDWVRSFLTDRRITLTFNSNPLLEVTLNHGTPQGSPMSPILSAIYILPLLRLAEMWKYRSLSTYMDDGAIFATGASHSAIIDKCVDGFFCITDWLMRNGLHIDPDKTEFITFQPSHADLNRLGALRLHINLQIPSSGSLQVRRSTSVRYLGVFINECFCWKTHASIMAAHVRSSLRGMHVLGNSAHGIDFHNWRTVFHAITLPILLYGLPVWSHKVPKSIVQILQVAQNDAMQQISGTFRTTPVAPLHNMLAIPPIKYTIAKYHAAFTACISHLPPTVILCTLPFSDPTNYYIPPVQIPTPLTSLLPSSFPVYCIPSNTTWTHTNIHNGLLFPKTDAHTAMILQIANNTPVNHTAVHVYPIPHPDHFVAAFLTFQNSSVIEQGFCSSSDHVTAAAEAAIAGVLSLGPHPGQHTFIFMPNRTLHKPLFSLSKHKHLPQATMFTATLQMQCFLHPQTTLAVVPLPVKLRKKPTHADPHVFACDWPGPRSKDYHLAELRAEAQLLHLPHHIPPPTLKSLPFRLWKDDQDACADPP